MFKQKRVKSSRAGTRKNNVDWLNLDRSSAGVKSCDSSGMIHISYHEINAVRQPTYDGAIPRGGYLRTRTRVIIIIRGDAAIYFTIPTAPRRRVTLLFYSRIPRNDIAVRLGR